MSRQAIYAIIFCQSLTIAFGSESAAQHKLLNEITIELKRDRVDLLELLQEIELTSDFSFAYTEKELSDKQINISAGEWNMSNLMNAISSQARISVRRVNEFISIKSITADKALPNVQEKIVQSTVSGIITDSDSGEPLIGATVQVKGTSTGSVTDLEGRFSLSIPESAEELIFSYIGYVSRTVTIGSQTTFNISLSLDVSALNEVVVVGYGSREKINLTGSITSIKGDLINARPITQTSQALQGLAPGVFVNTNSGEPGNDNASIVIRGIGTLNNSDPLVLIDGIEGPINSVNPIDIESVNVLKDAASASIYGTRAANGVILITTKRGTKGAPVVSYDFYTGITTPTVLPDMVYDNETYLTAYRDAAAYSDKANIVTDELIAEYADLPSTDYIDTYIGSGSMTSHNLSVSGGSDRVRYRLSTGYLDQGSYLEGDYYLKRLSNRLTLDVDVSDKVRAGTVLSYVNADNRLTSKQDNNNDLLLTNPNAFDAFANKGSFLYTTILMNDPQVSPLDEFGRYGGLESGTGNSQRHNPLATMENEWIDLDENDFLGNAFIEYEPIQNLKFRYVTGINYQQDNFQETRLEYTQWNRFGDQTAVRNPGSLLRSRTSSTFNFTNWLQASYDKSFGNHNFSMMVGLNSETSQIRSLASYETGFGSTSLVKFGDAPTNDIQNYNGQWSLASSFGRLNYNFDRKYLLEFNFRRDGSSRFGENSRWANFPGLSAGYVVSNEDFWKSSAVSLLKLRASVGRLGVQSSNYFPFASEFVLGADYNGNSGGVLAKLGNPNLQWEETTTIDFGLDVGFFDDRLSLEMDYFVKESDQILTDLANPLVVGVDSDITVNAATIENKGWEMALNFSNNYGDWFVSAGVNLTNVKNEVKSINPELTDGTDKFAFDGVSNIWWIRGESLNAMYGHTFGGIFQADEFDTNGDLISGVDYSWIGTPRPGDIKYTDQNGDQVIDETDRVVIGNRNPEWMYGFNLNIRHKKGFDLSAMFQGIGAADVFINRYTGNFGHAGLRSYYLDGYTDENPSTTVPRLWVDRNGFNGKTINGNGEQAQNSFWVQDRSYLRLKNIALGYTLPTSLLENLPFSSVRIYISGQNLLTITDLEELDPERADDEQHFTAVMPQAKSLLAGINITF